MVQIDATEKLTMCNSSALSSNFPMSNLLRRVIIGVIISGLLVLPMNTSAAQSTPPADPPIVPMIDAAMKTRLQAILADGAKRGNRTNVFAKIGDSITESGSFLLDFGCGEGEFGTYLELRETVDYFSKQKFPESYAAVWCGTANSFTRSSISAVTGWSTDDALLPLDPPMRECPPPNHTPARCELHLLKPSIAVIMYGTNDLEAHNDIDLFRRNLTTIVKDTIAAGTIPVLSTIPPRRDMSSRNQRVAAYNNAIIDVAREHQIPVMNYWRALTAPGMINAGLSEDGIHPNLYGGCLPDCKSSDLTAQGLRYGYNQRNLIALQTLAKVRAVVIEDGEADTVN
jgi:hypothetical protein